MLDILDALYAVEARVVRWHELLTARERQIAALAGISHSNKLIAYELGLSHSTVRVLAARACAKLGVRTRQELVERSRAIGLK